MQNHFLLFSLFIINIIITSLFSQVTIKEEMEITSSLVGYDTTYVVTDTTDNILLSKQSITMEETTGITTALVPLPDRSLVNVVVISRCAALDHDVYIREPGQYSGKIITDARVGKSWESPLYHPGITLGFRIHHKRGWNVDCLVEKESDTYYIINFEDVGDWKDPNDPKYNDIVIGVTINPIDSAYLDVLMVPDLLEHNEMSSFQIVTKDANHNILPLHKNTYFSISLDVNGQKYGQITDKWGWEIDPLNSSFLKLNLMRHVVYNANGEEPRGKHEVKLDIWIRNDPEVIGIGTLSIEGEESLDHFIVTLEPDTVTYSKAATIFIQGKNEDGEDIDPPNGTMLEITLDANGEKYGELIDAWGLPADPVLFTYENLKMGNIRYIANGDEPNGIKNASITATLMDNVTITGNGCIVLKDSLLLTIKIPEPKEVWPDLPSGNSGGNPNDRHKINNITVNLMKNLKPVQNHDVTINLEMILPSGGHYKNDQPPANHFGQLEEDRTGGVQGIPSITIQTQADGINKLTYTAMKYSGLVKFSARTILNNQELEAKDTLMVKIPDLVLLSDQPLYYKKIGGTCYHHGPSDYIPISCQTPDENHYGAPDVVDNLYFIAIEWQLNYPTEYILHINDMSLPFGGLFDKNGDWQTPHDWHRIGRSADIRTEFPEQREGIPIRSPRKSLDKEHIIGHKKFEQICRFYKARTILEGKGELDKEHYHLEFK